MSGAGTGWSRDLRERSNLTGAQFQIWLGHKLDPDIPLYTMAFAFELPFEVSPQRFERAFEVLVAENDAMRTIVEETPDGVPLQRPSSSIRGELDHIDLSDRSDPETVCRELMQRRCARPFDIERRMFDSALIRLGSERFVWYLAQHHLITDAQSCSLLFSRLSELYQAAPDDPRASAAPRSSFEDYVAHERARRRTSSGTRAEQFWQQQAAATVVSTEFLGRPIPTGALSTDRLQLDLGAERSDALRALTAEDGVRTLSTELAMFNLFATVLLAWLYRVGDGDRPGLGVPVSCRTSPFLRDAVGLLVELFPLSCPVTPDDSFADLLERVTAATRRLLANAVPGTGSTHSAVGGHAVLNVITATFGSFAGNPVRTEWLHCGACDRGHVVRLHVHDIDRSGRIHLLLDLARDVLDEPMRHATVGQLTALLDALVEDRHQPIATVHLGSPASPPPATAPAGDITADPPPTVLLLFRDQVDRNGDAVALASGEQRITYTELSRQARRLARALRARGTGRGSRVALVMDRSPEAITAMLAVLEAGGAFVPVDPADPPARRQAILDDAKVDLVVTREPLAAELAMLGDVVATVEELHQQAAGTDEGGSGVLPAAEDPAYVIYTSGSSGRPKGVVVRHRNLASYVTWARWRYADGARPTMPLFTSLSVDLTVTSIWVPLTTGGTVDIVADDPSHPDLPVLRVVREDRAEILKLTPTHLALVRDLVGGTTRLRTLVVGGENLRTELAAAVHHACRGRIAIVNEYGPTEATVGCTSHTYDPRRDTASHVPVGRPVHGAVIEILDRAGNPVPTGVIGELHVAGSGVAAGYLNRPQETAASFVVTAAEENRLVYRTGDLARWNSHGDIEIVGRADRQLKIRGIRIEPAEIEAAIGRLAGVRECLVAAVPRVRSAPSPHDPERFCLRCGLPADHPAANLDATGVCHLCHAFEATRERAMEYFGTPDEMRALLAAERATGDSGYDCMMLLSGGKDSTYALCQLVDMGLKVLAYTFDNGYISDTAKANNRRICDALGVDLLIAETPAVNEIFIDSIETHGGVCNGCFKALYVLATRLARERGIRVVVTGLSRAQLFATRLGDLHRAGVFDRDGIDRAVLAARKAYHRMDDAVSRRLNGHLFDDDSVFDEVRFVDFYRYHDVAVDDMIAYLRARVPWKRPSDTGCSTNCVINDVGIFVHRRLRGFHNYALPYSWEVRLGHKTRAAARRQLGKTLDMEKVTRILGEIGYDDLVLADGGSSPTLVAVYVADRELNLAEARSHLAGHLPAAMIPADLIRVEAIPQDAGGKTDRAALLELAQARRRSTARGPQPTTAIEQALAELWARALGLPPGRIGADDDFFLLGGDSLMVIQIVAWAREQGLHIEANDLFSNPTVASLARVVTIPTARPAAIRPATGVAPLTPIQWWYLDQQPSEPGPWSQTVTLELSPLIPTKVLDEALTALVAHHPTLRLAIQRQSGGWRQLVVESTAAVRAERVDLSRLADQELVAATSRVAERLHEQLRPTSPPLLRAALLEGGSGRSDRLLLVAHHLAVDAVSWSLLASDLAVCVDQLGRGQPVQLPVPTTPYLAWADHLAARARSPAVVTELDDWCARLAETATGAPWGAEGERDRTAGQTHIHLATLTAAETNVLVRDLPRLSRASVQETLLAAVAHALRTTTDVARLVVDLEGHGRHSPDEGFDLSRTVGWFTTLHPVVLRIDRAADLDVAVQAAKDALRCVPDNGISFGLLRYLHPDPGVRARLAELHRPSLLFNYMGSMSGLAVTEGFDLVGGISLLRDPAARRSYPLELNVWIAGGSLEIAWTATAGEISRASFERIAAAFTDSLRELIRRPTGDQAVGLVPSDFPHADLSQRDLDEILAEFGGASE